MIAMASIGRLHHAMFALVAAAVIIQAIMHSGGIAIHSAIRRKRFAAARFSRPGRQTCLARSCDHTIAMNAVRKNDSGAWSDSSQGIGSSPTFQPKREP